MLKSENLRIRVEPRHVAMVEAIQQATGLNTSQIFRKLIERAEVKPAEIAVNLSTNANSDVTTRQGSHVAVCA